MNITELSTYNEAVSSTLKANAFFSSDQWIHCIKPEKGRIIRFLVNDDNGDPVAVFSVYEVRFFGV